MEYIIDAQARGTRIISGNEARARRKLLNELISISERLGFEEIILPSIEPSSTYVNKAGSEILGQMYSFPDKKGRALCLRPEATATIQLLADRYFRREKDKKFWYLERCWRYEKPQKGRYREFFQFGLEILNPSSTKVVSEVIAIAKEMVSLATTGFDVMESVKRGLDYYTRDGFEISIPKLGAQKQVVGGGAYKQGIGFAIGFDRLALSQQLV